MLFILAFLLGLSPENKFKKGAVIAFVILFTLCHGPGTGAVPFVYSAEVFPTEWREMGMSLAVCVNFLGRLWSMLLHPSAFDEHRFPSGVETILALL